MKSAFLKTIIFGTTAAALISATGCALLGSDDDLTRKNSNIKYDAPLAPFVKLEATNADAAWQNKNSGNTIAINSSCSKDMKKDLKTLEKSLLLGLDSPQILSETSITVDGVDARRVLVEEKTEGTSIKTDLVTLKKGDCAFDLSYIGRKKSFDDDRTAFEKFISGFHAP